MTMMDGCVPDICIAWGEKRGTFTTGACALTAQAAEGTCPSLYKLSIARLLSAGSAVSWPDSNQTAKGIWVPNFTR